MAILLFVALVNNYFFVDAVTREQLVRVYGSLMWSMGKIFRSPEVVRVFTGSYWDEKLVHDDFKSMFESDEWLLINELVNLPKSCAERKVNEVVKRIRIIKVLNCRCDRHRLSLFIFVCNLTYIFDAIQ